MRLLHNVFTTAMLVISAAGVITSGCWPWDLTSDCELIGLCPRGSGTSSGGTPPGCVPSDKMEAVSNTCGVFASNSLGDDAAGDGTKDKPFKTLATAFMRANGKPVYACNEMFAEALVMSAGSELYGGLDCSQGWIYGGDTARTTIAPGADQTPVTLLSGSGTSTIENVLAQAADAMTPGGSSVAVKAEDGSTAELTRCDLTAGNGAEGEPAMPGDPNGMPAASGQPGNPGGLACSADAVLGGLQTINDCAGGMSLGGSGGIGQIASGVDGQNGTPDLGLGQGGVGEPSMGSWSCGADGSGADGADGTPGTPGPGATGMGVLTASGYQGVAGTVGIRGTPGQGGGGGGGAKGGVACSASTKGGASGGSGGSGGCGGLPGGGGGPGGASIGLFSFNANVSLIDCTITAANGGTGGRGGDAQAGGTGGPGGMGGSNNGIAGLNPGCDGGKGGKGGDGGPGGGGLGGPSFAITHVGAAPEQRGTVTLNKGGGGSGGPGGNNGVAANTGDPGGSADVQAF